MNIQHLFFYFLSLGFISPIALLLFSRINYIIKGILVSLTGGLWIYISINFLAVNFMYIIKDKHGVLLLLSMLNGIWLSIFAAGLIMTLFIEKRKLLDRSK